MIWARRRSGSAAVTWILEATEGGGLDPQSLPWGASPKAAIVDLSAEPAPWAEALVGALVERGAPVTLRVPGEAAVEIAGPLLPRGISVVRGLLPGEAGAPVARRCEALRPPMDRLRRLAAARPRSAGALRVEVAATLSPERLPELPILLLAVGPLKPRALRIRFDGPVPEGLLPAVVEALRCTAVEGRRLRCGLFVGGSGAISPALSVGPQAVEALAPAGSPDPGDGLIWRASPSP